MNATAADLTGSGDTYEFTVEPTLDGAFSVVVAAGAAADSAGNDSLATAELSWTSDRTSPTADLTYTGPTNVNAAVSMALHLSDDAVVTAGDFETTNATVSVQVSDWTSVHRLSATNGNGRACGARDYTVLVTPTADGPFSVKLKAGAFTDPAGNPNTASAERGATYDGSAPTVTELTAPDSANQPYDVQVEFSEDVLGFDLDTVVVAGGTASDLTGSDDEWGFTVTPSADATGLGVAPDRNGVRLGGQQQPGRRAGDHQIRRDPADRRGRLPVTGRNRHLADRGVGHVLRTRHRVRRR